MSTFNLQEAEERAKRTVEWGEDGLREPGHHYSSPVLLAKDVLALAVLYRKEKSKRAEIVALRTKVEELQVAYSSATNEAEDVIRSWKAKVEELQGELNQARSKPMAAEIGLRKER